MNGTPVTAYELKDTNVCKMNAGISDAPSSGNFYTWTNGKTWCKLDRVLVNSAWLDAGWLAHGHFAMPGYLSDHSSCIINALDEQCRGRKSFKFLNMWTQHDRFLPIVNNVWSANVYGSKMFVLCRKLKDLKMHLKELNSQEFSHISTGSAEANAALIHLQNSLHDSPGDVLLQGHVMEAKAKALKLANAEHSFLSQQAKRKYIVNSDKGTKLFHSIMKRNALRNYVPAIQKAGGDWSGSNVEVEAEFDRFYRNLLGSSVECNDIDMEVINRGPLVSLSQNEDLTRPVLEMEIKEALWSIGEDKAPGPDGYSSCFFKNTWECIKTDLISAVQEFFSTGKMLRQLNHSVLVLIPKSSHATKVENFRPIACCNVVYKMPRSWPLGLDLI